MNKRSYFLVILLIFLLTACNFTLAEDITPPPSYVSPTAAPTIGALFPSIPPSPARGKTIFETKCAPCHGSDGLGNGPQAGGLPVPVSAIGLRDIASQYNPAKWFTVITRGEMDRYMPPFTSLSDSERWDVLSYVYTLSNTPSQVEEGASLYAEKCALCHGPEGDGSKGQISGSSVDFSNPVFMSQVTSLGMYQSIYNGVTPKMEAFNTQLTDSQIWAITAYLRTLNYDKNEIIAEVPSATIEATATSMPTETNLESTPGASLPAEEVTPEGTQAATPEASSTPEATETPSIPMGMISGIITNGSGDKLPANLNVVLHGYVNMVETITLNSPVGADGTYEFINIPLESNIAFIVTADVDGIMYNSDIAVYDEITSEFDLPITIFENTADTSSISMDRLHIFFDFSNSDFVQVIEIYILSNSSNKTVVAEEQGKALLTYILPEGASNLQFENGQIGNPFITTDNGFGDPTSILPGASSYQLMYAFDMPYGKKLEINQPINHLIGSVIIMTPDGVKVSSSQMTDGGARDIQGQTYSMYTVDNIPAGETLSFTLSGNPKGGSTGSTAAGSPQTNLVIGLAIFGTVLILAGFFFFLRSRNSKDDNYDELDDEQIDAFGDDPDQLMDAIATLDDQFKAGILSQEAYQKRRDELKARLKAIL